MKSGNSIPSPKGLSISLWIMAVLSLLTLIIAIVAILILFAPGEASLLKNGCNSIEYNIILFSLILILLTSSSLFFFSSRISRSIKNTFKRFESEIERNETTGDALKKSQEIFQDVVKNMPVMFDAVDQNGVVLFWNKECERVTGYSAEEIVNNPKAIEIFYPDEGEALKNIDLFERTMGWYRDWEIELRCKNDENRIISWSNVSRDHPIPGWFTWGIGIDVTEKKKAEKSLRDNQKVYETIVELSNQIVSDYNPQTGVVKWSGAILQVTGFTPEEFGSIDKSGWMDRIHPDDRENVQRHLSDTRNKLKKFKADYRFRRKDETFIYVEEQGAYHTDETGSAIRMLCIMKDISERKLSEEMLSESREHYKSIFSNAPVGIFHCASDWKLFNANQFIADTFGYSSPAEFISSLNESENTIKLAAKAQRKISTLGNISPNEVWYYIETVFHHRNGKKIIGQITFRHVKNSAKGIDYYEGFFQDVTEKRETEKTLSELATLDDLTSLFNRRVLMECLRSEFRRAKRYSEPLSVCMLDLDFFKHVNDTYGHEAGDMVLVQAASSMKAELRETDICGRYGGEEFAVILPHTETHDVIMLLERLRNRISSIEYTTPEGETFHVTASIGVAEYKPEVNDPEDLLRLADKALYSAKKSGRNRVCMHEY